MKQKNLVILAGIPGAGKSTWVKQHLGENDIYVSRDDVRFSLISNEEEYFSHETETFDKFVREIEKNLEKGKRVFADATHINWASRRKLIERLHNREDIDIDVYYFTITLPLAIARNNQRQGRARVPEDVIRRMYKQSTHPSTDPFTYHTIKLIFSDGQETVVKEGE